MREASREELEKIDEVRPETAGSIAGFFADERNREVLAKLEEAGLETVPVRQETGGSLEGRTFVFTGELEGLTRCEAQRKVEELGGRTTSAVSSNTDYLVTGENPGSKLGDAREEGSVEILD